MDRTTALAVNTIRTLTIDAIQKAESGHPGLPMGCADFAFVLWTKFLRFNPANPKWHNRDRFVLSAGHGSMLIYSLLHLTGFESVSLDDIKSFRQWHSRTPGHPESHETPGVECTTGPLGQGTGNSVGMAIASKWQAATYNTPDTTLVDNRIYAIVSDGDLQEGISHEAAALAGHLQLDNLCWFYDDNHVSIEGETSLSYSDDVDLRFRGYHWNVIRIDGHDHAQIEAALREAATTKGQPTLIIGKTIIGKGSPKLQGTPKAHSDAFGEAEVAATKRNLGWPEDAHFLVPQEVRDLFAFLRPGWEKLEADWNARFATYTAQYPDKARAWTDALAGRLPEDVASVLPKFPAGKPSATRNSGGDALKALLAKVPWLIGGSADLAPSTKTWHKEFGSFLPGSFQGRTLHFGIREHGMASLMAGMCYYGGVIPFGATFFVFTDYLRPSLRLMALSQLGGILVMTHDSIFVGEDGPTHQPVETLASVRAIPNCCVIRPSDANEAALAWLIALENRTKPTVLALTRQNLPVFDRTECAPVESMRRGAYILWESQPETTPDLILIGTGSEVWLCLDAAKQLAADGRAVRVVAMPSWDLFEEQARPYRESVLPPSVTKRLAVEAGVRFGWDRYVGPAGATITMPGFGASAPFQRLAEEFGFTVANVLKVARTL
jgi:transketolase